MDPKLKDKVKIELAEESKRGTSSTIPKLCKDFNISDEYVMLSIIGDLETTGEAIMVGFDTVYREDGGAIYIAKYTGRV